MDNMKKPLLEAICGKVGCAYLSDLTQKANRPFISRAVREIKVTEYDEADWIMAAAYISVNKQSFESAEPARKYLTTLK